MKLTKKVLREIIGEVLNEAGFSANLKSKKTGKVTTFTNKDNYKAALKGSDYEKPDGGDEKEKHKTKATKISADPFAKDDKKEKPKDDKKEKPKDGKINPDNPLGEPDYPSDDYKEWPPEMQKEADRHWEKIDDMSEGWNDAGFGEYAAWQILSSDDEEGQKLSEEFGQKKPSDNPDHEKAQAIIDKVKSGEELSDLERHFMDKYRWQVGDHINEKEEGPWKHNPKHDWPKPREKKEAMDDAYAAGMDEWEEHYDEVSSIMGDYNNKKQAEQNKQDREEVKETHPEYYKMAETYATADREYKEADTEFKRIQDYVKDDSGEWVPAEPLFKDKHGEPVGLRDPAAAGPESFEGGEEDRKENERLWNEHKQKIEDAERKLNGADYDMYDYKEENDPDDDLWGKDHEMFDDAHFEGKQGRTGNESITSKLKKEFKEYDIYNRNMRKL